MKNMEILQRMPWLAKDSVFRKLADIAEVASMSKEERIKYDESLKHYRDTIIVLEGQFEKGREEGEKKGREEGEKKGREEGEKKGREEGLAEGEKKGIRDTARKFKEMGIPYDVIAKATGLTEGEIEQL